ncbi:MAG: hypothetical protein V7642_6389 [Burkholderiales bacterium]
MSDFTSYVGEDLAAPFAGAYWFDIVTRRDACPQLGSEVLLHAGPAFTGTLPAPVRNAALQAILFEGMASDSASALALLATGGVRLEPAQDHRVVTPLAQVVSASMPMAAVGVQGQACFAPLVEGPAPALRFGASAPECRQRLHVLAGFAFSVLAPLIRTHPVALDQVIRAALAQGDECHSRTGAANEALASALQGLNPADGACLRANQGFVLPILMAAAAWRLATSNGPVEAIGGNGIEFGIRRRGERAWRTVSAEPPRGTRFAGNEAAVPLNAIGDSAVVDFCGLGGQALLAAPALVREWAASLPADAVTRRSKLVDPHSGIVDPQRVIASGVAPLINLAILDSSGHAGLLGRGFCTPNVDLFADDTSMEIQ